MMRQILFHRQAMQDFDRWLREKPVVYERIRRLIKETAEHPFEGIGKPCAGKSHARFDEGRVAIPPAYSTFAFFI